MLFSFILFSRTVLAVIDGYWDNQTLPRCGEVYRRDSGWGPKTFLGPEFSVCSAHAVVLHTSGPVLDNNQTLNQMWSHLGPGSRCTEAQKFNFIWILKSDLSILLFLMQQPEPLLLFCDLRVLMSAGCFAELHPSHPHRPLVCGRFFCLYFHLLHLCISESVELWSPLKCVRKLFLNRNKPSSHQELFK